MHPLPAPSEEITRARSLQQSLRQSEMSAYSRLFCAKTTLYTPELESVYRQREEVEWRDEEQEEWEAVGRGEEEGRDWQTGEGDRGVDSQAGGDRESREMDVREGDKDRTCSPAPAPDCDGGGHWS